MCLLNATTAVAQSAPAPMPSASGAASALTPAERAKRDADKVFQLIMIHSDKPRSKSGVAKEEPTTAAVKVKPVTRAPAKDDDSASKPDAAPAPVVATAPMPMAVPAPAAQPGASVVAASTVVAAAPAGVPAPAEPAIETLTPLARGEPQFPQNLLRSLRKGQVQVQFTVLPDGTVDAPTVLASSSPRLNASVLAAVTQWRFAPLTKAQSAVVEVGFDIE
jgi:TonB family protein